MKKAYTLRIDSELLKKLKKEAKVINRSFNNYVETLLKTHQDRKTDKV